MTTEQQLCQAHPDDCPNGPGPHAYHPPEVEGLPCCRQPERTSVAEELEAMEIACSALRELDGDALERALFWLGQRLRNLGGVPF